MPDQTITDEDLRRAHEWAYRANDSEIISETALSAARAIRAHVPAPPKSLADGLRRFGAEYLSESLEDKLSVLADLAKELEHNREKWREAYREARTIAEGHLASIKHREERIETLTAERDAARNSEAQMQEQFNQMYEQSQKITNQRDDAWAERDAAREEVERLKEEHSDTLHDRNVLYDRWKMVEEKVDRLTREGLDRNPETKARMEDALAHPERADTVTVKTTPTLPDPADVPTAQPWLVRDDQGLCLGVRCDSNSSLPWLLVRVRNGNERWRTDADVTLVRPIDLDGPVEEVEE